MATLQRIRKELELMVKDPPDGCSAGPFADGDVFVWKASIMGPSGTPYEQGVFFLELVFPQDYPLSALQVKFQTRIYHPNVGSAGEVGLDVLGDNWSPALTVGKVLSSIMSLLRDPNPEPALQPQIAEQWLRERKAFDDTARQWTRQYAM
ncbi:ubiquitin-conjugating enzyme E2 [Pseudomonas xanthosomatis]|uniref:ubiquitin-conjugating enzyme E2 n=1 Tax=Pseudomonas xanthosomatis TaxID=2842356 RepID=UPI001C3E0E30|nr:ubiquitin-conjugating enzyme E2 [Pseudomonas xanthosomatis]QXH48013.1 ubiquitin-conjugating enzyme E2 [Pseudomonas xanthosomatis]